MGQAKRRKQQLGDLYGTPAGSKKALLVCQGASEEERLKKALVQIRAAQAAGKPVKLIGTAAACPLAEAAGLRWLHEIPASDSIPTSFAWDPMLAESGGPLMPEGHAVDGVVVIGARASEWLDGFELQ